MHIHRTATTFAAAFVLTGTTARRRAEAAVSRDQRQTDDDRDL